MNGRENGLRTALREGDLKPRLSFLIMGFGNLANKQIVKGILFLTAEAAFLLYMIQYGAQAIWSLRNLGDTQQGWVYDETLGIDVLQDGDNSMLLLLFGIAAVFVVIGFLAIYRKNVMSAYQLQLLKESGEPIPTLKQELRQYLDSNLYVTLMGLPMLGIFLFTILPLVFMILVAFTNFDSTHQPPGNLFTWVGLQNFVTMLGAGSTIAHTFWPILG